MTTTAPSQPQVPPTTGRSMPWWSISLRGLAMGAADVVPGVSGGTMALILGIYSRLIHAIKNVDFGLVGPTLGLCRGNVAGFIDELRNRDLLFVAQLLLGVGIAVVSFAKLIPTLLDSHPEHMRGLFFGMILASIVIPYKMMERRGMVELVAFAGATAFAYWFSTLGMVDVESSHWFLFICGMIAICAMILPGISGSFLLLILGQYRTILDAVHQLDVVTLAIFAAGAIVGITSFSRVLALLLDRCHAPTMAALCGLMVGSLTKIWPFKLDDAVTITVEDKVKTVSDGSNVLPMDATYTGPVLVPVVLVVAGLIAVLGLSRLGDTKESHA